MKQEGWSVVSRAQKNHYFMNHDPENEDPLLSTKSLCGKWFAFSTLDLLEDDNPQNCQACARELIRLEKLERLTPPQKRA